MPKILAPAAESPHRRHKARENGNQMQSLAMRWQSDDSVCKCTVCTWRMQAPKRGSESSGSVGVPGDPLTDGAGFGWKTPPCAERGGVAVVKGNWFAAGKRCLGLLRIVDGEGGWMSGYVACGLSTAMAWTSGAGRLVDLFSQGHNFASDPFIPFDILGDFLDAVAHGAVIPPAEQLADID